MDVSSYKDKIKRFVEQKGIEIFELGVADVSGETMIRILVDYPEGGIDMQACARLNKELAAFLESEGINGEGFSLEVSSPGLNRKLKEARDFRRVRGLPAVVFLSRPINGASSFEGVLLDASSDSISLLMDAKKGGNIISIPLDKIEYGKVRV